MMRTSAVTGMLAGVSLVLLLLLAAPSIAERRVALVVGNGKYVHTPVLANPANDAVDVAAALRDLGFSVIQGIDLDRDAFEGKLREFAGAARGAETALLFYAGHGIQVAGENYLLPVDARLSEELDLDFEALALDAVLRQMRSRVNLVFLDACRDNPLAKDLARSMGTSRSAAVGRGLGRVDAGSGTLIAYATQPGNVAADGEGRNSPFTKALLVHIAVPGRSVNDMLAAVTGDVATATKNRQQPWVHSSLRSPFHFREAPDETPVPGEDGGASGAVPGAAGLQDRLTAEQLAAERLAAEEELLFWESVKDSDDPADLEAYRVRYPDGRFAALATNRLERLKTTESAVAVPPRVATKRQEDSLGLRPVDRLLVQLGLHSIGINPGPADGVLGRRTRAAVREWQPASGMQATGYLDGAAAQNLRAKGVEALLSGAGQGKVPPGFLEIVRGISDSDHRAWGFRSIAYAQAEAGDIAGAMDTARGISDSDHRAWGFRLIAGAQAEAGDIAGAMDTARGIFDSHYERATAFRIVAQAQAEAGDIADAMDTVREISDSDRRASAFGDIAGAQAEAGDIAGAMETARGISNSRSRGYAFMGIALAQAEADDIAGAMDTARGISSDSHFRARAFSSIAQAQARAGDIAGAKDTARGISSDSYYRGSAFGDIAGAQAEAGDIAGAMDTARGISDSDHRASGFRSIAYAQAEAGDIAGAMDTARGISDSDHRAWGFRSIAGAQAEAGDIAGAMDTARGIFDSHVRAWAFIAIANAQAGAGDAQGAGQSLLEALNSALESSDPLLDGLQTFSIAKMLLKAGARNSMPQ